MSARRQWLRLLSLSGVLSKNVFLASPQEIDCLVPMVSREFAIVLSLLREKSLDH